MSKVAFSSLSRASQLIRGVSPGYQRHLSLRSLPRLPRAARATTTTTATTSPTAVKADVLDDANGRYASRKKRECR